MSFCAKALEWRVRQIHLFPVNREHEVSEQKRRWAPAISPALTTLPEEILAMIIDELGLEDLLRMREVSRLFNQFSKEQYVWRSLFLRMLGTIIPRPFFLPRRLKDCSYKDIESSLRRWRGTVKAPNPIRPTKRRIRADTHQARHPLEPSLTMVPGGRWVIAAYSDGSIWSFDLSNDYHDEEDIIPQLLIPSPFSEAEISTNSLQIRTSFDFESHSSIGSSRSTHHLEQFNMAVVGASVEDYESPYTHVAVYQIRVSSPQLGDGEPGDLRLVLEAEMSAFRLPGFSVLMCCSLHDTDLAVVVNQKCMLIMNWVRANGTWAAESDTKIPPHRYLESFGRSQAVQLIDGGLLVVPTPRCLAIYDWKLDFEVTTVHPYEQPPQFSPPLSAERAAFLVGPPVLGRPFTIQDKIHLGALVLNRGMCLTISTESHAEEDISLSFYSDSHIWDSLGPWQAYGCHRVVGLVEKGLYTAQFTWDTDEESTFKVHVVSYDPVVARHLKTVDRLLYDVYTNRVVIFGNGLKNVLLPRMCSRHSPFI